MEYFLENILRSSLWTERLLLFQTQVEVGIKVSLKENLIDGINVREREAKIGRSVWLVQYHSKFGV